MRLQFESLALGGLRGQALFEQLAFGIFVAQLGFLAADFLAQQQALLVLDLLLCVEALALAVLHQPHPREDHGRPRHRKGQD